VIEVAWTAEQVEQGEEGSRPDRAAGHRRRP